MNILTRRGLGAVLVSKIFIVIDSNPNKYLGVNLRNCVED